MSGRGFDRGKRHERDNRSRGRGGGRGNYQQAQSNQNITRVPLEKKKV